MYNIEEFEQAVEESKTININFNPKSKLDYFRLGYIFAAGKYINVINKDELELLKEEGLKTSGKVGKSFPNMILYWANNKLSPDIIDNANLEKMFLICPVRNATEEQKQAMALYIKNLEDNGYQVHYPERDTNQNDTETFGYRICFDNASAMALSSVINIYYDKQSTGSLFDLGVTYYLMRNKSREVVLLNNDITLDENDFGDYVVSKLISKQKAKQLTR